MIWEDGLCEPSESASRTTSTHTLAGGFFFFSPSSAAATSLGPSASPPKTRSISPSKNWLLAMPSTTSLWKSAQPSPRSNISPEPGAQVSPMAATVPAALHCTALLIAWELRCTSPLTPSKCSPAVRISSRSVAMCQAGTACVARPRLIASAAPSRAPVRLRKRAVPRPTPLRKAVLPASGQMPMAHSGMAKVVVSVTSRRLPPMKRPAPAPITTPLPTVTTGRTALRALSASSALYSSVRKLRAIASRPSPPPQSPSSSRPSSDFTSPPAQNARESAPSPASAERTSSPDTRWRSRAAAWKARSRAMSAATPSAFSFFGTARHTCVRVVHDSLDSG
mmetsp:Transcript_8035/g.22939  ORF Transcript_8035/g.22939 Transcript_8035/m.22939 type:complete len:337 (-) Transcript_8035:94-1104(-)